MSLFTQIPYTLQTLIANIDSGILALPEIQRPFVWENAKVRDLLDSMYRGYPVGTLLFWLTSNNAQAGRSIGQANQTVPHSLIVDGQQRLTGLYAVIKGVAVLRNNYEREHIRIAFNPLKDEFMVPDGYFRHLEAGGRPVQHRAGLSCPLPSRSGRGQSKPGRRSPYQKRPEQTAQPAGYIQLHRAATGAGYDGRRGFASIREGQQHGEAPEPG